MLWPRAVMVGPRPRVLLTSCVVTYIGTSENILANHSYERLEKGDKACTDVVQVPAK
jgi:hypothetical protein